MEAENLKTFPEWVTLFFGDKLLLISPSGMKKSEQKKLLGSAAMDQVNFFAILLSMGLLAEGINNEIIQLGPSYNE